VSRAKRRGNGEGTIYQRTDGRYAAEAYVLLRGGVRKRRIVYGRTREEVAAKLTALLNDAQQGVPAAEKGWTVERTFREWRAKSRAPHCIRLPNGQLRIARDELARWVAEREDVA
jgi:hypothetical protein